MSEEVIRHYFYQSMGSNPGSEATARMARDARGDHYFELTDKG